MLRAKHAVGTPSGFPGLMGVERTGRREWEPVASLRSVSQATRRTDPRNERSLAICNVRMGRSSYSELFTGFFMLLSGIVALLLVAVPATDTSQKRLDDAPILIAVQASADSLAAAVARLDATTRVPRPTAVLVPPATVEWTPLFPVDTPRARPRAVEVSDWYNRRLTIHRYLSYSVVPIFAVQYMAGRQLWDKGRDAPDWAKTTHRVGATALAGIFTVNTVTGVWNLWDSRSAPQGRALRTFHAITMLAADAGFTYAGAKLSQEAETSLEKRRQHRTLALSSMGLTIVSGVAMKLLNQ